MFLTGCGFWLRRFRRQGQATKVAPAKSSFPITKFSIEPTPGTPAELGRSTLIIPRRRFLPESRTTARFARLAENTYRLEEGFLCGPVSFGDVVETEQTDQERVLLFRRRIKRGGFNRKCYVIPHRIVDDPEFRALTDKIEDSGGFAAVDFGGLFLVFLPKPFDLDVAAELDRIVRHRGWKVPPTSKGEPT